MDSPQAVQDGPVRVEADHAVLHGHPVQKGLLVVQEVGVRQPQLVSHPVVQGQVERKVVVGQAFVPPALLEVHGDGVILGEKRAHVSLGPLQLQPFTPATASTSSNSLAAKFVWGHTSNTFFFVCMLGFCQCFCLFVCFLLGVFLGGILELVFFVFEGCVL